MSRDHATVLQPGPQRKTALKKKKKKKRKTNTFNSTCAEKYHMITFLKQFKNSSQTMNI